MNRGFNTDKDDEKALKDCKKMRRTRNNSQIIREALWHYRNFLFNQNTHTSVYQETEKQA